MRKNLGAVVVPSLWAAAALFATTALIAEISAEPTWDPGIHSSTWTPVTGVTALFFGHSAFHGDLELLSIAFGLFLLVVVSLVVGAAAVAFIAYCLGWSPHPAAAAILGTACGLAAEILLINLLCNWLQSENGVYTSMPSWGWWVGWATWGATLGLTLSRAGRAQEPRPTQYPQPQQRAEAQALRGTEPQAGQAADGLPTGRTTREGAGGGVARHSPLLSADPSHGSLPQEPTR